MHFAAQQTSCPAVMRNDRHYSPRRSRSPFRRRDDDHERTKTYTSRRDYDDKDRHYRGRSRSRSLSPARPGSGSTGCAGSRSRSPRDRRSPRSVTRRRRRSYSRSRSRSRDRKERKRRDRSASSSSGDEKKKRKKDKERRRSRSRSRERKKDEKRRKKEKKEKKKHGSSSSSWGKYGIISELDMFTKSQEFHTWLVEERKINPETISKDQSRKEFARFVEDYNTATLPHEKYYDMTAYERRMNALKQGEFLPPSDDAYDPRADMKTLSSAHKRKPAEHESFLSRDQLLELRKVQHERIEAGKRKLLGMEVKQNMGVRMDVDYT
ncbi:hypothetical protein AX15_004311 [Amanita polypyramis BW_CC]|nr:hypothetical protein AX15_004311 [Amanita polypyramis BW_CC]